MIYGVPKILKYGGSAADVTGVMIDDMDHMVTTAVTSVFGTMLNFAVSKEPPDSPIVNGEPHIAGSVGFIGTVSGVVFVYSTASFAKRVTRGLLGLKDAEPSGDEIINDAVGEITNMVVGNIKSRLADRGMKCILTIPSVMRGSHFTIEPTSASQRRVCIYRCDGKAVVAINTPTTPVSPEQFVAGLIIAGYLVN